MMAMLRITIVLLLAGWFMTQIDGPPRAGQRQPHVVSAWRHTALGWEHSGRWAARSNSQSRLNPLLVALEEIFICVVALALWRPAKTVAQADANDTGRALDVRRTP